MTSRHTFAISPRVFRASSTENVPPSKSEGAGNAGRSLRPQPCVRNKKAHKHSHHGHTGNTRHSPRNGFNGFLRALLGDRACLPPSSAKVASRQLDASVGTSGPHDFAVRRSAPSSEAPPASTASRPASVTIASRPSVGQDGRACRDDLPDGESEIFFDAGLDRARRPSHRPARRANHLCRSLQLGAGHGAREKLLFADDPSCHLP